MTRRPGAGDLTFVPIGLPPAEAEVDPVAFEILFPCGSIVRVPPHFDADGLARFVRVLSTTC